MQMEAPEDRNGVGDKSLALVSLCKSQEHKQDLFPLWANVASSRGRQAETGSPLPPA